MNSDKRVLVTGGAGYIGSHACKALKKAGLFPVTFDNLVYGHRDAVKWGPLIEGDLTDLEEISAAVREVKPVAVMHFAAYAYVGESVKNPGKYYRNNVLGSLNLLEAMRDSGVDKLVFSSSCSTYGVPERVPISEGHTQNPVNPYGATKLMMERMMADFSNAHGLKFVALRYFNAAGSDPECEIGERHDPETHLIPLVLDAALGRRPFVTVFGEDYPTPDGTCIRDYIHVSDLAEAHLLALGYLDRAGERRAFNLGNGTGYSVKEVIRVAEQVSGRQVPVRVGARREGDPPQLVGDASLARKELGWNPRYGDLKMILSHAWEHRRKIAGIRN